MIWFGAVLDGHVRMMSYLKSLLLRSGAALDGQSTLWCLRPLLLRSGAMLDGVRD